MASAITSFGADAVLGMLFGATVPVPQYFYFALLTQPPGEHASGDQLSEPDPQTGYSRVQVLNTPDTFGEAENGFVATIATVEFATATDDWPVITHYALCEQVVGGEVYLYGSFTSSRRVAAGDKVSVPPGLLSLAVTSLTTAVVGAF